MNDGGVPHHHAFLQIIGKPRIAVNHGQVLYVDVLAQDDPVDISADDAAIPDVDAGGDGDVAQHGSVGGLVVIADAEHGTSRLGSGWRSEDIGGGEDGDARKVLKVLLVES